MKLNKFADYAKIGSVVITLGILFFTISWAFHRIESIVESNQQNIVALSVSVNSLKDTLSVSVATLKDDIHTHYVTLSYFDRDMDIIKKDLRSMQLNLTSNTKEINLVVGRSEIMENQIEQIESYVDKKKVK